MANKDPLRSGAIFSLGGKTDFLKSPRPVVADLSLQRITVPSSPLTSKYVVGVRNYGTSVLTFMLFALFTSLCGIALAAVLLGFSKEVSQMHPMMAPMAKYQVSHYFCQARCPKVQPSRLHLQNQILTPKMCPASNRVVRNLVMFL